MAGNLVGQPKPAPGNGITFAAPMPHPNRVGHPPQTEPRGVQAKMARGPSQSVHIPGRCNCAALPHAGVIQRSQGFASAWSASSNTKSGFKTNNLVGFETSDGDYIELGTASNHTSTAEHAEDVAIRIIGQNMDMFTPNGTTNIYFHLTSSPCTSVSRNGLPVTGKGCAETLVAFFGTGNTRVYAGNSYSFKLRIFCTGLYAPQIAGQQQSDVLDASQEAVDYLRMNGIEVVGNERPSPQANRFELA